MKRNAIYLQLPQLPHLCYNCLFWSKHIVNAIPTMAQLYIFNAEFNSTFISYLQNSLASHTS